MDFIAGKGLTDDGGYHRAETLTEAVSVEGAEDDNLRTSDLTAPRKAKLVASDFARGVDGLRMEWMLFGDRDGLCAAVNFSCGNEDHPAQPLLMGNREGIHGHLGVSVKNLTRVNLAVRNADMRGKVEEGIATGDSLTESVDIAEIAPVHGQVRSGLMLGEQADRPGADITDKGRNLMPR